MFAKHFIYFSQLNNTNTRMLDSIWVATVTNHFWVLFPSIKNKYKIKKNEKNQ